MQAAMARTMLTWRRSVSPYDPKLVRRLCREAGNFSPCEVELAVELVMERLHQGENCGYHFLFAQLPAAQAGYACYGPVPCTDSAWDLYWVVVDKTMQGNGLGRLILQKVEHLIGQAKGMRIYLDTSGRPDYDGTRCFYEKCGYEIAAQLPGFYAEDDAKIIYKKELGSRREA